jgi:hypothetical protein
MCADHTEQPAEQPALSAPQQVVLSMLPPKDPLWLSALRGRMLAVLASGLALWGSAGPAWREVQLLWTDGATAAHVGAVLSHVTALTDHGMALVVAGGSLIALLSALASKLRSRWHARQIANLLRLVS